MTIVKNSVLHIEAMRRDLYNIDRADNGIYLAGDAEAFTDVSKAYPSHNGSHPRYDEQVNLIIGDLTIGIDVKKLDDNEIDDLLAAIEDKALGIIENWSNNRLN